MSMTSDDLTTLRTNWRIVVAAMAGWGLDAFDFTMLLFLIPHLRTIFNVSLPQMALVVTGTGLAKVLGTIAWGAAADKFGRKLPFMVAVIWFSLFCGLSGLAWSYASFLVLRLFFGIGFGGEWSAVGHQQCVSTFLLQLPGRKGYHACTRKRGGWQTRLRWRRWSPQTPNIDDKKTVIGNTVRRRSSL